MDKLLEAYSGDRARGYDERRAGSSRWKAEIAAMDVLLDASGAKSVVDCPFGTGRWVPQYEARGMQVTGIDLSRAMLDEAQAKVDGLDPVRTAAYRLVEGSIFDVSPEPGATPPDLVACIRFLNWVDFADARRALQALDRLGAPQMIVGASVVPQSTNPLRRAWYRLSLALINLRAPDRRAQHVHPEADLLAVFADLGFRVVDRRLIMRRNARVNYFYHLRRG